MTQEEYNIQESLGFVKSTAVRAGVIFHSDVTLGTDPGDNIVRTCIHYRRVCLIGMIHHMRPREILEKYYAAQGKDVSVQNWAFGVRLTEIDADDIVLTPSDFLPFI